MVFGAGPPSPIPPTAPFQREPDDWMDVITSAPSAPARFWSFISPGLISIQRCSESVTSLAIRHRRYEQPLRFSAGPRRRMVAI